ncbi:MAG: tRNA lysidine(34) synthetase TilS [Pseudomonadota bacterium]
MTYSAEQFAEQLFADLALEPSATFYVAYSGGVDSTVLLHLLAQARETHRFSLKALHVNHNLQPNSADWARHCENVCNWLQVPLQQTSLQLSEASEVAARNARYKWFQQCVGRGNVLLTAHHRQDRVETVLFNLMRGAGSAGLSSLRSKRPFFGSTLVRPLLQLSQDQIMDYAFEHGLSWVEDPSNLQDDYSRNHIRQHIIPALSNFRGDAVSNIARAATNLEQENSLLREIAICDLVDVREHPEHPLDGSHALCFEDMVHLSRARQANLVRFWLASLQLHIPSKRLLDQLLQAFKSPPASTAILQEDGFQFRFYRGFMYAMPALTEAEPCPSIDWKNINQPVDLYRNKLRVDATDKLRNLYHTHQRLRSQAGGFRFASRSYLSNPKALQGHSLNLKKWLQEMDIPPWRRQALPLLTFRQPDSDVVLGPVDMHLQSDWVSLECPLS